MGDDLFSASWSQGDLSSIPGVVSVLSWVATIVISTIGFGIIISALLKNSAAALYASYPRFWDKVDQVKMGQAAEASGSGDNRVTQILGSITTLLLSCCPNVKKMTDFDKGTLDAKMYFMRAIPMMVVVVFIGVFVFKGYPMRVAEYATDFGTGVIDVVLENTDPTSWVEALPSELAVYSLVSDNAEDDTSKNINKVTKEVIKKYVANVDDLTKDVRVAVARKLETWVEQNTTDYSAYCDTDAYKCSITVDIRTYDPSADIARIHQVESEGTIQFGYAALVSNFLDAENTAIDVTDWYVMYIVKFTKIASSKKDTAVTCAMTSAGYRTADNTITITAGSDTTNCQLYGLSRITGTSSNGNKVILTVTNGGCALSVTGSNSSSTVEGTTVITGISGLWYQVGGVKHPVTKITLSNNGTATFTATEDTSYGSWSWGEAPSNDESSTTTTTSSGSDL